MSPQTVHGLPTGRCVSFFVLGIAILGLLSINAFAATVNCSGVPAWSGNSVNYSTGQLVTYQGSEYKCVIANTSESNWDPIDAPALWSLQGTCSTGPTPTPTPTPTATPTATPLCTPTT